MRRLLWLQKRRRCDTGDATLAMAAEAQAMAWLKHSRLQSTTAIW